ncbi:TetR family transcriptional regulator [Nocardioides sp. NPDC006303]|uniref:TetR/AcrR family transcriptional regulator n=1 Tax=Nocardioides sp. NPDC006303 TaxID=3156747 RepID=UPI00339DF470
MPIEERRKLFIDATIRVIAAEGVARATTRRIAAMAAVPAASLHYCFRTKEALFQAVFEKALSEGPTEAGRRVVEGMGLREGVAAIVGGYLDWMIFDRDAQQAQFELIFWALRSPSSRHLPKQTYWAFIDATIELLRRAQGEADGAVDLDMLARKVIAVFDGHAMQWISLDDSATKSVVENAIREIQAALPGGGLTIPAH